MVEESPAGARRPTRPRRCGIWLPTSAPAVKTSRVVRFVFGGRHIANRSEQPTGVEPIDPRERGDLEASLPGLRACRQLLVVIPASREEHPRIVDLLRDVETLGRLRRVHCAFGEALREEQMSRALDFLDTHER